MRGKPSEAGAYSTKPESRLTEQQWATYCNQIGSNPTGGPGPFEINAPAPGGQGTRTDLSGFTDDLKDGKVLSEVAMARPETFVRYHNGFAKLACYYGADLAKKFRKLKVVIIHGKTGVGKTRKAIEWGAADPGGYYIVRKDSGKTMWYDMYEGQKVLIMDEYRGNWMTYSNLLTLLDGQQQRLPIKGAHVYAFWHTVLITSCTSYKGWYDRQDYSELERRITEIIHLDPLAAAMPPVMPAYQGPLPANMQPAPAEPPCPGPPSPEVVSPWPLVSQGSIPSLPDTAVLGPGIRDFRPIGRKPQVGVIYSPTYSWPISQESRKSPAAQPVNDFSIWNGQGLEPNLTTAEVLPAFEEDEDMLDILAEAQWEAVEMEDEESFLMSE